MTLRPEHFRHLRSVPPGRHPMFHHIFRADPLTVRDALVYMRQRFLGSAAEEVIAKVELALAEVLNNICKHGGRDDAPRPGSALHPPLIHLCIVRHVGGIACAVTDDGKPLPPQCLDPRDLPFVGDDPAAPEATFLLPEGGFGWYLIQDLTASLSYFREGRRNFLAFIVPVGDPQGGEPAPPGWKDVVHTARPS